MEVGVINQVTELINGVGFPIFVAAYTLMRTEKVLKTLNETMIKISEKIGGVDD